MAGRMANPIVIRYYSVSLCSTAPSGSQPMNPATLLRALSFASLRHRRQRRKDAESSPYINHPIAVATVLALEGGIEDEAVLVAAILHDTVEDTGTSFEEIAEQFGANVEHLVREVTDDRSLSRDERKQQQVLHARSASAGAKQLKIADKICNVRDVTASPPVLWSRKRRLEYLDWSAQVVDACRGVNPALDAAFDASCEQARQVIVS